MKHASKHIQRVTYVEKGRKVFSINSMIYYIIGKDIHSFRFQRHKFVQYEAPVFQIKISGKLDPWSLR